MPITQGTCNRKFFCLIQYTLVETKQIDVMKHLLVACCVLAVTLLGCDAQGPSLTEDTDPRLDPSFYERGESRSLQDEEALDWSVERMRETGESREIRITRDSTVTIHDPEEFRRVIDSLSTSDASIEPEGGDWDWYFHWVQSFASFTNFGSGQGAVYFGGEQHIDISSQTMFSTLELEYEDGSRICCFEAQNDCNSCGYLYNSEEVQLALFDQVRRGIATSQHEATKGWAGQTRARDQSQHWEWN